jgi:hypothetical protein
MKGGERVHRRRRRARPTPKWILKSAELDRVTKARCLMVLSVLSGEKPVTEAIEEGGISRGTYYQLETRALNAMLRALSPTATDESIEEGSPVRRIVQLEEKVKKLEQVRRRSERLLILTRKVVKGRVAAPRSRRTSSTGSGKTHSPGSRGEGTKTSIPTAPGVAAP